MWRTDVPPQAPEQSGERFVRKYSVEARRDNEERRLLS
jgi:hypothetical protein